MVKVYCDNSENNRQLNLPLEIKRHKNTVNRKIANFSLQAVCASGGSS